MCGLGSVIITIMPVVWELKLRSLVYVEIELSNFRHPLDFRLSFAFGPLAKLACRPEQKSM